MPVFENEFVTVVEAETAIQFAISRGETLLTYGTEDPSDIESWLSLAALSLESVPTCLDSLQFLCFDLRRSNRDRVGIALSILRDAAVKIHDPPYAAIVNLSEAYQMLIARIRNVALFPAITIIPDTFDVFLI